MHFYKLLNRCNKYLNILFTNNSFLHIIAYNIQTCNDHPFIQFILIEKNEENNNHTLTIPTMLSQQAQAQPQPQPQPQAQPQAQAHDVSMSYQTSSAPMSLLINEKQKIKMFHDIESNVIDLLHIYMKSFVISPFGDDNHNNKCYYSLNYNGLYKSENINDKNIYAFIEVCFNTNVFIKNNIYFCLYTDIVNINKVYNKLIDDKTINIFMNNIIFSELLDIKNNNIYVNPISVYKDSNESCLYKDLLINFFPEFKFNLKEKYYYFHHDCEDLLSYIKKNYTRHSQKLNTYLIRNIIFFENNEELVNLSYLLSKNKKINLLKLSYFIIKDTNDKDYLYECDILIRNINLIKPFCFCALTQLNSTQLNSTQLNSTT